MTIDHSERNTFNTPNSNNIIKLEKLQNSEAYKELMKIVNKKGNNENAIQAHYEKHPSIIPLDFILNHGLHYDIIIKKPELPNGDFADFMYLTKSSSKWYVVFIELESSNKKLFTKKNTITSELNACISQVNKWISCFDYPENCVEFKKDISELLTHLPDNKIEYKFVLIIGREDEINSQEKRDELRRYEKENFSIKNYDSKYNCFDISPRTLLSLKRNGCYKLITCEKNSDKKLLLNLYPNNIEISDTQKEALKNEGYHIEYEKKNVLNNFLK